MDYAIGQIFTGTYPPEAAQFCNESGTCYITEIDADADGNRRFQIVAVPEPTFDELKERKLSEMKAAFDTRVSGSFTTSQGYVMQFNRKDSELVSGSLTDAELNGDIETATFDLVQADNTIVEGLNYEEFKTVFAEMLAAYRKCYYRKQELRAIINACTTADELDAVEITWPV